MLMMKLIMVMVKEFNCKLEFKLVLRLVEVLVRVPNMESV